MQRNGYKQALGLRLAAAKPTPDPEEAVAITAAIERFVGDTQPQQKQEKPAQSRWMRQGFLEGVGLCGSVVTNWQDPHPWGRR
jgi:hypothetical protein